MGPQEHGFTYLDLQRTPTRTGRLRGWILSAKDLNDVAGMPTTLGNAKRTYYPAVSEPFIAKLEKQGAIFIGKSSTPELGLRVDTEPVDLPHPDNPLYPGRTPGGSSGGAAVQVARGLVRAAQASDGGGSIRVPAAACGVVGFKPAGDELGVQGFITRTVADNAFLHGHRMITPRARIVSQALVGAEGPLANGPGELLDDRQRDVGIEQRPADVPDRAVDVGLGEAPLAAKVLEGRGQAVGQGGEHRDRVAVGVLPPRGRPPDVAGTATVPGDLASTPDRRGRAPAVDRRARRGGAGQPRSGPSAATMRSPRSAAEAPGASARPSAPVTTRVSHA